MKTMQQIQSFLQMIEFDSPVILTFALVSFAALILNTISREGANRLFFSVYRSSLLSPLTYVRFFTHVLGHGSLSHYVGNMMIFLLLGPSVEANYGSNSLVFMIAATALVTGLVHFIFFPRSSLRGASGIVYMLIMLSSMVNFAEERIPLTFLLVVILYLGKELYGAIFRADNVSQLTHIIGAAMGIVFVLYYQGMLAL